MDEQQFIYGRLKYLNEQINFLTDTLEKHQEIMSRILDLIDKMQSPEYASKQAKLAEMKDVADKIKFMREYMKK